MGITSALKKHLLNLFSSAKPSASNARSSTSSSSPAQPAEPRSRQASTAPTSPSGTESGSLLQTGGQDEEESPAAPSEPEPNKSATGRIILQAPTLVQAAVEGSDEILIKAEPNAAGDECRFLVNRPLLLGQSWMFTDAQSAESSPLPAAVFGVEGITTLLVDDTTLTVTRDGGQTADWRPLAEDVGRIIREQLLAGATTVADELVSTIPDEDSIREQIQEVIDEEVNPGVAAHSGFISLTRVRGNSVYISMGGGCQGCSAADQTLKQGIHQAFRNAVPQVGAIYDETDHSAGTNPYFS